MNEYKIVIDRLIEARENPEAFFESHEDIRKKDYARISEAIEAGIEDSEAVLLGIKDIVALSEGAAYIQGVCDGLRLK